MQMRLKLAMAGAALVGITLAAAVMGAAENYHFVPDKSANYVEVSCSRDGYTIETPKLTLSQYLLGRRPSTDILHGETVGLTGHHFAPDGNGGTYEDESYGGVGTRICTDFILTADHVVYHKGFSYTAGDSAEVLGVYKADPSTDLALLEIPNHTDSNNTGKTRIRISEMKKGELVIGVTIDPTQGSVTPFTRLFKEKGGPPYDVESASYNEGGTGVDTYERRQYLGIISHPDGTISTGAVIEENPATELGWSGTSLYDTDGNLTAVLAAYTLSTGIGFEFTDSGIKSYQINTDYAVGSGHIVDFLRNDK